MMPRATLWTSCLCCHSLSPSMLATKLNLSADDAERWIVNLIRNAKLDAKIDAKEVSSETLCHYRCTTVLNKWQPQCTGGNGHWVVHVISATVSGTESTAKPLSVITVVASCWEWSRESSLDICYIRPSWITFLLLNSSYNIWLGKCGTFNHYPQGHVVMNTQPPSIYQRVIDKTKALAFQSQFIAQNIDKRLSTHTAAMAAPPIPAPVIVSKYICTRIFLTGSLSSYPGRLTFEGNSLPMVSRLTTSKLIGHTTVLSHWLVFTM